MVNNDCIVTNNDITFIVEHHPGPTHVCNMDKHTFPLTYKLGCILIELFETYCTIGGSNGYNKGNLISKNKNP